MSCGIDACVLSNIEALKWLHFVVILHWIMSVSGEGYYYEH
jgi:hypothetical protein